MAIHGSTANRRLFAAVQPPPEAIAQLSDLLEPHQVRWPEIRWTDASGWHLTTVFARSVNPTQYLQWTELLAELASRTARFGLGLVGIGSFPAPAIAHTLWIGADDPTDQLTALANGCRRAANRAGLATENRQFVGHLTLARFNSAPADVRLQLQVLAGLRIEPWPVTELVLMESLLGQGPGGRSRYVVVERFPLAAH